MTIKLTPDERSQKISECRGRITSLNGLITHYNILTNSLTLEKNLLQQEVDYLYELEREESINKE